MADDEPLPNLAAALESRYPGVTVWADLAQPTQAEGDRDREPWQRVCFNGPASLLIRYNLVPASFRLGDRHHGELDEFGTVIMCSGDGTHVYWHHPIHSGELQGASASQHPDNAKTRATVSKILSRLARGAHSK